MLTCLKFHSVEEGAMTDPVCDIRPVTPGDWPAFEALMGPKRGGSGGCWCMLWRLDRKAFDAGKGEANRDAIRALFARDPAPGLIAYADDKAVGWVSVAPRPDFPYLARSRLFRGGDAPGLWSVSCLTVARDHRRKGVSVALLNAAADHAQAHGAAAVEGYPVAPDRPNYPPVYSWTGLESAFRKAGFEEVARPSLARPVMRRTF